MKKIFFLFFNLFLINTAFAAFPYNWQLGLQEAASPVMHELNWLHNFLLIIITGIVLFVIFLITYVAIKFNKRANPIPQKFTHNVTIEIIWTIIPIIILIIIAIPSFRILELAEKTPPADVTVKVVGSQWYWSYIYPDHGVEFDSYMIEDKDLKPGQIRLLEVDNRIVVPKGVNIKFLITAADVIHSFAIPALGLKTDAVPGRTNEAWTRIDKPGIYYGQCSELCGVKHGFMPIAIEVVSQEEFEEWIEQAKDQFAQTSILTRQLLAKK